jgi:hypothetical protein
MSTSAPHDGGSNPSNLKDKLKHPIENVRHKLHETKLHDLKVRLIQKK